MDLCKIAVESALWGFGAAAVCMCGEELFDKVIKHFRNPTPRAPTVDWAAQVVAAVRPPENSTTHSAAPASPTKPKDCSP